MTLRDDTRGQAIQIGAVLLFGVLIIAFSSYQAFVVPDQNREVEFKHNQEVQQDMQDLRNTVVSLPGAGNGRSISVTLGTQYPSRLAALNPGPATGTLRTAGTTDGRFNLTLRNATASESESPETEDFWNGTDRIYPTGSLVYRPDYNVYQGAPETVYENSVVHNQQRDGTAVLGDQRLVDGKEITLVTLNGSLDDGRAGRLSVDVRAASSSDRTVSVWNESHNPTIELPTRLGESDWRDLLEAERTDGYVTSVSVDEDAIDGEYGLLSISLQADTNYTLRMAKAGVGSGVETPGVEYITDVEGSGANVLTGTEQRLVLEVRDRYNNPVSDADVSVVDGETTLNGGELDQRSRTTGTDGRVRFTYTAGSSTGDASITFNVSDDADVTPEEKVTLDLSVIEGGSSDDESGGNLVYRDDSAARDNDDGGDTPGGVTFSLRNDYTDAVTIQSIRFDPQNDAINGISDKVGDGNDDPGETEVYATALDGGTNGFVEYRMSGDEYVAVGPNGLNVDFDDPATPTVYGGDATVDNGGNPQLSVGESVEFSFYEFYTVDTDACDDTGCPDSAVDNVDMNGETVDVEVTYSVGSGSAQTQQYTFAIGESSNSPSVVTTSVRSGWADALEFRLRVDSGVEKTITEVETSVPGNTINGQEVRDSITELNRGNEREVELSVVDGATGNRDGYRNAPGGGNSLTVPGTYDLDQDAIFGDGAELDVYLGEISYGQYRWIQYEEVDSKSESDIAVTFRFSDGTKHEVYLDVTVVFPT